MQNIYAAEATPVSACDQNVRAQFITRTYSHLFGAIAAFTLIEVLLFRFLDVEGIASGMSQNWFMVLGAFMLVSWLATSVAHRARSMAAQYAALALFVVFEAIVFVPLLYIANTFAPGVIESAALMTLVGFAGLTAIAFFSRKDFSFLGGVIRFAFFGAIAAIGAALIFGFTLGTFFSVAMVVLAGATILYDTSNVLRHYPQDRYVAASLSLFASVAMMFWFVLRIFLAARD